MAARREERIAVVLVDHGSRVVEANRRVVDLARRLRSVAGDRLVTVEPAHMELAGPSVSDAFAACAAAGVDRIVVVPYFLAPGRHVSEDIPRLAAEAAATHDLRYSVTAAFGMTDGVVELLLDLALEAAESPTRGLEPTAR